MKKLLTAIVFVLSMTLSAAAMIQNPRTGKDRPPVNHHPGGGGTPEPATILLILGGIAAAYGTKKVLKK